MAGATMQLPFIIELFQAIKSDRNWHITCFIGNNGSLSMQKGWDKVLPYLDGAMI
ncbi:hypothetical protein O9929_23800 [Vibrio lentus]|nr:hypothetical protein [Vibrio lentus]